MNYLILYREKTGQRHQDRALASTPELELAVRVAEGMWKEMSGAELNESILIAHRNGTIVWKDGKAIIANEVVVPAREPTRSLHMTTPHFPEGISTGEIAGV